MKWLIPGKSSAICFSIDDVHPGRSSWTYDGGGDLGAGALGHVERLLGRHPQLRVTLFTTPDWREIGLEPVRRVVSRVPGLRNRVHLVPVHPKGAMRLSRHPRFATYLRELPQVELALHGLHHIRTGLALHREFQGRSRAECRAILREAMALFDEASLPYVPGIAPPGWDAPAGLLQAAADVGLQFVASARDIRSPIHSGATAQMSGLRGVSLVEPEWIAGGRLVHLPTNFQATSTRERAERIIGIGGVLSVKAHIVKVAMGRTMLDGVDEAYMDRLHELFCRLEDTHGDSLWWTTMGEISQKLHQPRALAAVP